MMTIGDFAGAALLSVKMLRQPPGRGRREPTEVPFRSPRRVNRSISIPERGAQVATHTYTLHEAASGVYGPLQGADLWAESHCRAMFMYVRFSD
jgi:hypothetical protein